MGRSPYFIEWYRAQHERKFATLTGDMFEDYVASVLRTVHVDFVNPDPAGRLGDRKCDGLADAGRIFYACYGSRPEPGSTEAAIVAKINSDFDGAVCKWDCFSEWRFITNARTGPDVAHTIIKKQAAHGPTSQRPLTVVLWKNDKMWQSLMKALSEDQLDSIFPGAPGAAHPDLYDLVPLLDRLNSPIVTFEEEIAPIREVPPTKMDFNELDLARRAELNAGRTLAPHISYWYDAQGDPDLSDKHGRSFRTIYEEHATNHADSGEIMEAMYESLAGTGFRRNAALANAVYGVTAYFFDSCQIFEEPPESTGAQNAASN